jgi:hypothetical protein
METKTRTIGGKTNVHAQPIEFSDTTNRLHRNMIAAAAIITGTKVFDLQIEKAALSGIEIKNFTSRRARDNFGGDPNLSLRSLCISRP